MASLHSLLCSHNMLRFSYTSWTIESWIGDVHFLPFTFCEFRLRVIRTDAEYLLLFEQRWEEWTTPDWKALNKTNEELKSENISMGNTGLQKSECGRKTNQLTKLKIFTTSKVILFLLMYKISKQISASNSTQICFHLLFIFDYLRPYHPWIINNVVNSSLIRFISWKFVEDGAASL